MRHLFLLFYAWLTELFRKPVMISDTAIKLLFIPGFNGVRTFNGRARAYAEFVKAKRNVPAYSKFLKSHGFSTPSFSGIIPNLQEIPYTDKENYVKMFSMDDRSVYGKVPSTGVVIDESSGSSGMATNWARGYKERQRNGRFIRFGMRKLLGDGPLFIINAFALGPWATGMNITMSCLPFSRLKSLGPDALKIENTIRQFGKGNQYIVMGYPPFLKMVVDHSEINWKEHDVTFIFGGESMSEGMRDYLIEKGIRKIYSSFGASDLELNIASENDFTIRLRRLLRSNPDLQKRILRHPGALPMVFQFHPADFLFETTETGELLITVCRPGYIAPKIRYNIHDRGHVLQMKELRVILKELHVDEKELGAAPPDLPILFHYGRADMSVSFFGSTICPGDIQDALFNLPDLVGIVNSFSMKTIEDGEGNKQLIVSLELHKDRKADNLDPDKLRFDFFEQLAKTNQDFREAKRMSKSHQTAISFFEFGQGPFESRDPRIKARYV